jgi:hypothetical protein
LFKRPVVSEVVDELYTEMPNLSDSMMVALEDIVQIVDNVLIEEIDEADEDEDNPQPSTSSTVTKSKRALLTDEPSTAEAPLEILPGGRSNAPIRAFFKPDDKEIPNPCGVGTHLENMPNAKSLWFLLVHGYATRGLSKVMLLHQAEHSF